MPNDQTTAIHDEIMDDIRRQLTVPQNETTTLPASEGIRKAWRRLSKNFRWMLIEWHLGRVVSLINPDDEDALPLLTALSKRYDQWNVKP